MLSPRPLFVWPLIGVLMGVNVLVLRHLGALEFLELSAYDQFLRLHQRKRPPDPRLGLIRITEEDIAHYGYPLSDAVLADALQRTVDLGARTIGVDIYRDRPVPPGSEVLGALIRRSDNIIWISKFSSAAGVGITPPAAASASNRYGFSDIVDDPGGIIRRGLLFLDDGAHFEYAFALQLTLNYLSKLGVRIEADAADPRFVRLGETTIPPLEPNEGGYANIDARGYQFLLDFVGVAAPLPSATLGDLLEGRISRPMFEDQVVLIGATTESVKDHFYTPFSGGRNFGRRISGVDLQALIASQLIRLALGEAALMRTFDDRLEALWITLWCLLGSGLGLILRSALRFALLVSGGLLLLGVLCYWSFIAGWWVPIVPAALGWVVSAALMTAYMTKIEKAERQVLMQLFSRHVSSNFAELIWSRRRELLAQGRLRPHGMTVTVMFTDIVGFTDISERTDPDQLMHWLNDYMEPMVETILQHGGVIQGFAGDSILAYFGVPIPSESEQERARDATNAVYCALAMEDKLEALNRDWDRRGQSTIRMRVGINTGYAVAGSLGGGQRIEYAIIGDAVNTAARLESFDKSYGGSSVLCRILIGEPTRRLLGERFVTERVGRVQLKGKEEPITLHRVHGRCDS